MIQRESNGLAQRNIAEQHWDQENPFGNGAD